MKVDNLLAQYLYKYKRLSLYGIGIFTLDDSTVFPDENAKVKTQIEGVSFVSDSAAKLDDSLIEYIKAETGKMKSLAQADLDSYTTNAHEFLNIGKPFYFEGIGTLQKNKDGSFSFNAGTAVPLKTEQSPEKFQDAPKRKSVYAEDSGNKSSFNPGKLLAVLGVLITLGLIGWGTYYMYKKNTSTEPLANPPSVTTTPIDTQHAVVPIADSSRLLLKKDSLPAHSIKPPETIAKNTGAGYKFILETTTKKSRALQRFNQIKGMEMLKGFNAKIEMESRDSSLYRIFTIVPCAASDTSKYKDSLNVWYYGGGKRKVTIEQ